MVSWYGDVAMTCSEQFEDLRKQASEWYPDRCADLDVITAAFGTATVQCFVVIEKALHKKSLGSITSKPPEKPG